MDPVSIKIKETEYLSADIIKDAILPVILEHYKEDNPLVTSQGGNVLLVNKNVLQKAVEELGAKAVLNSDKVDYTPDGTRLNSTDKNKYHVARSKSGNKNNPYYVVNDQKNVEAKPNKTEELNEKYQNSPFMIYQKDVEEHNNNSDKKVSLRTALKVHGTLPYYDSRLNDITFIPSPDQQYDNLNSSHFLTFTTPLIKHADKKPISEDIIKNFNEIKSIKNVTDNLDITETISKPIIQNTETFKELAEKPIVNKEIQTQEQQDINEKQTIDKRTYKQKQQDKLASQEAEVSEFESKRKPVPPKKPKHTQEEIQAAADREYLSKLEYNAEKQSEIDQLKQLSKSSKSISKEFLERVKAHQASIHSEPTPNGIKYTVIKPIVDKNDYLEQAIAYNEERKQDVRDIKQEKAEIDKRSDLHGQVTYRRPRHPGKAKAEIYGDTSNQVIMDPHERLYLPDMGIPRKDSLGRNVIPPEISLFAKAHDDSYLPYIRRVLAKSPMYSVREHRNIKDTYNNFISSTGESLKNPISSYDFMPFALPPDAILRPQQFLERNLEHYGTNALYVYDAQEETDISGAFSLDSIIDALMGDINVKQIAYNALSGNPYGKDISMFLPAIFKNNSRDSNIVHNFEEFLLNPEFVESENAKKYIAIKQEKQIERAKQLALAKQQSLKYIRNPYEALPVTNQHKSQTSTFKSVKDAAYRRRMKLYDAVRQGKIPLAERLQAIRDYDNTQRYGISQLPMFLEGEQDRYKDVTQENAAELFLNDDLLNQLHELENVSVNDKKFSMSHFMAHFIRKYGFVPDTFMDDLYFQREGISDEDTKHFKEINSRFKKYYMTYGHPSFEEFLLRAEQEKHHGITDPLSVKSLPEYAKKFFDRPFRGNIGNSEESSEFIPSHLSPDELAFYSAIDPIIDNELSRIVPGEIKPVKYLNSINSQTKEFGINIFDEKYRDLFLTALGERLIDPNLSDDTSQEAIRNIISKFTTQLRYQNQPEKYQEMLSAESPFEEIPRLPASITPVKYSKEYMRKQQEERDKQLRTATLLYGNKKFVDPTAIDSMIPGKHNRSIMQEMRESKSIQLYTPIGYEYSGVDYFKNDHTLTSTSDEINNINQFKDAYIFDLSNKTPEDLITSKLTYFRQQKKNIPKGKKASEKAYSDLLNIVSDKELYNSVKNTSAFKEYKSEWKTFNDKVVNKNGSFNINEIKNHVPAVDKTPSVKQVIEKLKEPVVEPVKSMLTVPLTKGLKTHEVLTEPQSSVLSSRKIRPDIKSNNPVITQIDKTAEDAYKTIRDEFKKPIEIKVNFSNTDELNSELKEKFENEIEYYNKYSKHYASASKAAKRINADAEYFRENIPESAPKEYYQYLSSLFRTAFGSEYKFIEKEQKSQQTTQTREQAKEFGKENAKQQTKENAIIKRVHENEHREEEKQTGSKNNAKKNISLEELFNAPRFTKIVAEKLLNKERIANIPVDTENSEQPFRPAKPTTWSGMYRSAIGVFTSDKPEYNRYKSSKYKFYSNKRADNAINEYREWSRNVSVGENFAPFTGLWSLESQPGYIDVISKPPVEIKPGEPIDINAVNSMRAQEAFDEYVNTRPLLLSAPANNMVVNTDDIYKDYNALNYNRTYNQAYGIPETASSTNIAQVLASQPQMLHNIAMLESQKKFVEFLEAPVPKPGIKIPLTADESEEEIQVEVREHVDTIADVFKSSIISLFKSVADTIKSINVDEIITTKAETKALTVIPGEGPREEIVETLTDSTSTYSQQLKEYQNKMAVEQLFGVTEIKPEGREAFIRNRAHAARSFLTEQDYYAAEVKARDAFKNNDTVKYKIGIPQEIAERFPITTARKLKETYGVEWNGKGKVPTYAEIPLKTALALEGKGNITEDEYVALTLGNYRKNITTREDINNIWNTQSVKLSDGTLMRVPEYMSKYHGISSKENFFEYYSKRMDKEAGIRDILNTDEIPIAQQLKDAGYNGISVNAIHQQHRRFRKDENGNLIDITDKISLADERRNITPTSRIVQPESLRHASWLDDLTAGIRSGRTGGDDVNNSHAKLIGRETFRVDRVVPVETKLPVYQRMINGIANTFGLSSPFTAPSAQQIQKQEDANGRPIDREMSAGPNTYGVYELERIAAEKQMKNSKMINNLLESSFTIHIMSSYLYPLKSVLRSMLNEIISVFSEYDKRYADYAAKARDLSNSSVLTRNQMISTASGEVFSSIDVTNVAERYAASGINTKRNLEDMTYVIKAATIAQTDYNTVANAAIKAQMAFGLSTKDISMITDAWVAGANASTAELSDMITGFQYVASSAKNAGLSVQDTAGYLAMLDSQGLANVATSFRQLLMTFRQRAKRQNFSAIFGFTDDDYRDMNKVLKTIRDYVNAAESEEERNRRLLQMSDALGGKVQGFDALQAYINVTDQQMASITNAVRTSGYTNQMYADITDNLTDSFNRLRTELQSTYLLLGENIAPFINVFVKGVTNAAEGFNALPRSIHAAAAAVGVLTLSMTTLGTATVTAIGGLMSAASLYYRFQNYTLNNMIPDFNLSEIDNEKYKSTVSTIMQSIMLRNKSQASAPGKKFLERHSLGAKAAAIEYSAYTMLGWKKGARNEEEYIKMLKPLSGNEYHYNVNKSGFAMPDLDAGIRFDKGDYIMKNKQQFPISFGIEKASQSTGKALSFMRQHWVGLTLAVGAYATSAAASVAASKALEKQHFKEARAMIVAEMTAKEAAIAMMAYQLSLTGPHGAVAGAALLGIGTIANIIGSENKLRDVNKAQTRAEGDSRNAHRGESALSAYYSSQTTYNTDVDVITYSGVDMNSVNSLATKNTMA